MVLSLVEFTQREISNLGTAIIPLNKPDLSRFPEDTKQEILYEAINHLVQYFQRETLRPSVGRAFSFYSMMKDGYKKDEAKERILEGAEDLEDHLKIAIYYKLGEEDKLHEMAEEHFNPNRMHWRDKDLGIMMVLHHLIGKCFKDNEKEKLILNFLFESKNPWRLSHSIDALNALGRPLEIKENNLVGFIRASEEENQIYIDTNETDKRNLLFEKTKGIVSAIAKEAEDFLKLADTAFKNNCYDRGSSYLLSAIKRKTDKNAGIIEDKVTESVDKLLSKGLFFDSEHLLKSIGKNFDYEKAYNIFISHVKKGLIFGFNYKNALFCLLYEREKEDLRSLAEKTYRLIEDAESRINKSKLSYSVYTLALGAYLRLGDVQKAFEIAEKAIIRKIMLKESFKDVEILKNSYENLPENPVEKARARDLTEGKKEPPNLRKKTLEDAEFLGRVLKAYDSKGVEGVQGLIEGRYHKWTGKNVNSYHLINPIEALSSAFSKVKRDVTDDDRINIVRYCLQHGMANCGFDYQALHYVQRSDELRKRISPAEWALGATTALLRPIGEDIQGAIEFAELSGAGVPPVLYRMQAIKGLSWSVNPHGIPKNEEDDFKHEGVDVLGAYQNIRKAGDKGLIAFMESNFAGFIQKFREQKLI